MARGKQYKLFRKNGSARRVELRQEKPELSFSTLVIMFLSLLTAVAVWMLVVGSETRRLEEQRGENPTVEESLPETMQAVGETTPVTEAPEHIALPS